MDKGAAASVRRSARAPRRQGPKALSSKRVEKRSHSRRVEYGAAIRAAGNGRRQTTQGSNGSRKVADCPAVGQPAPFDRTRQRGMGVRANLRKAGYDNRSPIAQRTFDGWFEGDGCVECRHIGQVDIECDTVDRRLRNGPRLCLNSLQETGGSARGIAVGERPHPESKAAIGEVLGFTIVGADCLQALPEAISIPHCVFECIGRSSMVGLEVQRNDASEMQDAAQAHRKAKGEVVERFAGCSAIHPSFNSSMSMPLVPRCYHAMSRRQRGHRGRRRH